MKTKFFSLLLTCFVVTSVFSQSNLNDYKYVIVPNQYGFLKSKDQYQLNSLSKFLFEKYGFQALMEGDEYPEDLIRNRCLALRSDVIKDNSLFRTKLAIELKGCNDQVIHTSEFGESREKDFKKSYHEAIRKAFKSFETINYKYKPNENILAAITTPKVKEKSKVSEEIQKLREEIQSLKNEKKEEVIAIKKPVVKTPVVVEQTPEPIKQAVSPKTIEEGVKEVLSSVLYAQEIENGFQLVDSSPKVVYRIKKTGLNNVFLVENKNAVIYKKGDSWVVEYYSNNVLKQEELNIKF